MKRLLTLTAVTALALILTATAGATRPGEGPPVIPIPGHYEGRDTRHHHIRFYFNHHGHVTNFRVEHADLGSAVVESRRFHVCKDGFCAHGSWIESHQVSGSWNNRPAGHGALFSAHFVHPSHVG